MHLRFVSLLSELFVLLANRVTFAIILIEEIIYNRSIELALVDLIFKANFIDTQLTKIKIIIAKFRVALLRA